MEFMPPDIRFMEFLTQGIFKIQRSRMTGRYFFYPRIAEPGTGSTDFEWVEVSGRGTVYSATVVRQKSPAPDYSVVLVDLEEGPRVMSRIDGIAPASAHIGMSVKARIITEGNTPVLVFVPR
jgi:uncharacterized OB-fold protein